MAIVRQADDFELWDEIAEWYQNLGTDAMVAMIQNRYPKLIISDEVSYIVEHKDVEGEIQDETSEYILTWENGIGECLRIYKIIQI